MTYLHTMRKVLALTCSSCQYGNDAPTDLVFRVDARQVHTAAGADAAVARAHVSDRLRACLNNPPSKTIIMWVHINFEDVGHASAVLFDTRRRLQIVFDPDWKRDDPWSISNALTRHQFHPAYTVMSEASCAPPTWSQSIQRRLQAHMHADELGICGILTIFVLVCCIRFNYLNPKHVANIIADYIDRPTYRPVANQLISWYDKIRRCNGDAFRSRVFVTPSDGMCRVYGMSTRACCPRKSCNSSHGDRAMCWQHRYLVRNNKGNMKCASPQQPCA